MRNIKLTVEYDGTDFHGWQMQPNVRTVQHVLQSSLAALTQESVQMVAAGRTDAGVHALGQVVNFHTSKLYSPATFLSGGNARLPADVRILSAEEVAPEFDSRKSAKRRIYRYVISRKALAIGRHYAWFVADELDLTIMNNSCSLIIGQHDFQAFCQAGADVEHYLCTVFEAKWLSQGAQIVFEITANRFLHHMVRSLVGTFVDIGSGKYTDETLHDVLVAKDRSRVGVTAPPHGLFLVQVVY